ncbi:MAG: GGDEF domain-containing protein [Rhodoferax sp.]|nr:GGDEF domain-containing protein [Rhodoferax sp.]
MAESPARYRETKEQSAEIFRQVLTLMGQHDAPFNPLTYAVWYEFAAGTNQRLNKAIEQAQKLEARLSGETVFRLYRDHVAEADAVAMQQISSQLQRVMEDVSDSAARAGQQATDYGGQLGELVWALKGDAPAAARPMMRRMLDDTEKMGRSAKELADEVSACRIEIDRLSAELSRALDDAVVDPLTRILNRKGFNQRLADMVERPPRKGEAHCLIILDIDHFKKVNDTYGHVMGDRVIQALGELLRTGVSVVPGVKSHSVARYGGEEFAVLLPNCSLTVAADVAEALRQRAKAIRIRDRRSDKVAIAITISGGMSSMRPADNAETLIERADRALYQAKLGGRDRIVTS